MSVCVMPAPNAVAFCELKRSEAKLRVYVRCRQTLRPFPALPYRQDNSTYAVTARTYDDFLRR
jgi:hypothetical protein